MGVIDCIGSGRQRGLAHGESAREQVRLALARWEEATLRGVRSAAGIMDYAQRFLATTGLITRTETVVPDLLDEIRGIADGAGLPYELIAAYNLMDEQWWYELGRRPGPEERGCSLVAISVSGTTLMAQTMDLPSFMEGSQIILRIKPPADPEALVLSAAGLIGLCGVNSVGVAIGVNTLLMLRHDAAGLPVAALVRAALGQRSRAAAATSLSGAPHASGQHYAVADRSGVVSLECSARGCDVGGTDERSSLTHTNHPLASDDLDERALARLEHTGRVPDSRARLAFLDARLGESTARGDLMRMLADRSTPICIGGVGAARSSMRTFAAVLFELSTSTQARFCLGRPGEAPWEQITFSNRASAYSA